MTQFNLNRGLEAWYELASVYYDNERNRIQDKSGYGRHAKASGGPTIGINGPGEFEATIFDGQDDAVRSTGELIFGPNDVFSWSSIGRIVGDEENYIFNAANSSDPNMGGRLEKNRLRVDTNDIDGSPGFSWYYNDYEVSEGHDATEFTPVTFIWDGEEDTIEAYMTGELLERKDTTFTDWPDPVAGPKWGFGVRANANDNHSPGESVFGSLHSRRLNESEIKYLHNLTGPRRSML